MKTTVEVQIDIEDVYSELTYSEQQEFIKSHIDDIGGLGDVVELCFDNDCEVKEFVEANIDKLSDEALINEIKKRELEVNL
ncbi:hypothetical protein [Hoylesella timonensis]|uniref:hypothetical protein n=1 Tax=Hoylesella timonensis TaxID=386414 RepID=UPI0002D637B0|nr:hypothetical protein [Hoylesella timonensis]